MHLSSRTGLSALFPQKRNSLVSYFGHIINPLLTKFVRPRWLDIGLVSFSTFFIARNVGLLSPRLLCPAVD